MRRAVLDIGSNTIRLLVADVDNGDLTPVADRSDFVRLGRGVDKSGLLLPERMETGVQSIARLAAEARELGAGDPVAIATSAVRDARNSAEFVRRVEDESGVRVEIISGDREAGLTFRGAAGGLDLTGGAIVCDLGGGSAELIAATADGIQWQRSEKLGSGRLTERFVHEDPAGEAALTEIQQHVKSVLATLPAAMARAAIFTGGTASHVALLLGKQGAVAHVSLPVIHDLVTRLAHQTTASLVAEYGIRPERAEVLPAGAAALAAIADYYRVEGIVITRRGIREGALLEAADA